MNLANKWKLCQKSWQAWLRDFLCANSSLADLLLDIVYLHILKYGVPILIKRLWILIHEEVLGFP